MTGAILDVYEKSSIPEVRKTVSEDTIKIVDTNVFYPVEAGVAAQLWEQSPVGWEKHFENSMMVHFFSHQTLMKKVTRNPIKEAYSYLGPKYCPVAFWFSENF